MYPDVPPGDPQFGEAIPCECTLLKAEGEKIARLQRYSNLGPLTHLTFDNLKPRGRNGEDRCFEKAYSTAKEFALNPQGWILFYGPGGCGKTHLACAIANFCLKQGREVKFVFIPDLLEELRMSRGQELFREAKRAPLIILDDLGPEAFTAWASDKLYQIVNSRYNYRLPTITTTSLSLEEMETRISSRMADPRISVVFNITAPDFRTDRGETRRGRSSSTGR